MITRESLIDRLLALPNEICAAELAVWNAQTTLRAKQDDLADAEASLLLADDGIGPVLNGKNSEQRAAQLRQLTEGPREALRMEQIGAEGATVKLRQLRDEFSALRAVARLLEGARD